MLFCLGEGKYESKGDGYQKNNMVFNQKVTEDEFKKIKLSLSNLKISLTHWVKKEDMTNEEKENNNVYKEIDGYLKIFSYKEAWKNYWDNASQSDKDLILNIPQFDNEIFKGITGIDVIKDDKADKKKKELIDKAEELRKKADELLEQANTL